MTSPHTPASPATVAPRRSLVALLGIVLLAGALLLIVPAHPAVARSNGKVIVIDAGHQRHADLRKEPIGPGSSTTKYRVSGGASGVATHTPEYRLNLRVARLLRDALKRRGYTVYMVRTSNDVHISNKQRAAYGNSKHADLVIRVHANGSSSRKTQGFMTMVPNDNRWTSPIYARSLRAGKLIHRYTLKSTHARNSGLTKTGTLTGFNWSKVPCVLVEMGYLSSPVEDRRLQTHAYEIKLVHGFAEGTDAYFGF